LQVWLHKLESDQSSDACLYHERDDTFSLGLQASESKRYLFVESGSKNTSFIFYLDTSKQNKELLVLTPRVSGIDTTASHRGNHFFITRRSDEFYNSELIACPLDNVAETTVLLPHRERYLPVIHVSEIILTVNKSCIQHHTFWGKTNFKQIVNCCDTSLLTCS
jgi:oligopeptidase B